MSFMLHVNVMFCCSFLDNVYFNCLHRVDCSCFVCFYTLNVSLLPNWSDLRRNIVNLLFDFVQNMLTSTLWSVLWMETMTYERSHTNNRFVLFGSVYLLHSCKETCLKQIKLVVFISHVSHSSECQFVYWAQRDDDTEWRPAKHLWKNNKLNKYDDHQVHDEQIKHDS